MCSKYAEMDRFTRRTKKPLFLRAIGLILRKNFIQKTGRVKLIRNVFAIPGRVRGLSGPHSRERVPPSLSMSCGLPGS